MTSHRLQGKHDLPAIMGEILRAYALPLGGYHGVVHWARVLENGLRVAEVTSALHTDGIAVGDPTLLACWDADRLDLGRVGITPEPNRLCTDAARDLLPWADHRATNGYVPAEVLVGWGLGQELCRHFDANYPT